MHIMVLVIISINYVTKKKNEFEKLKKMVSIFKNKEEKKHIPGTFDFIVHLPCTYIK